MAGSLKSRLARLRGLGLIQASSLGDAGGGAAGRPGTPAATRGAGERAAPAFLAGWGREEELVWSRELRRPLTLPASVDAAPLELRRLSGPLPGGELPRRPEAVSGLRFFDLETSGLSGGTGTVAFLAAVGRIDAEGFAVRQFFLEDYPGEGAFVEAILAELRAGDSIVTYNGRAFDLPLLRTRCVMNGLAPVAWREIDLLGSARRLWARPMGGAALGLLERELLGVERERDVPGSMIPDVWFEYLRRGDHPLMPSVMEHNAQDVLSLARLLGRAAAAFEYPRSLAASSQVDRGRLGRTLLALGRKGEGEELLEAAAADGDERAGLFLSSLYRRELRVEDRRRVLDLLPRSQASCVERAKFHEYAMRDLDGALGWAAAALELADTDESRAAARKRISRLGRKRRGRLGSASGGRPTGS